MVRSPHDAETAVLTAVPGRHRRGGAPAEQAIFVDRSGRRKRRLTWVLALAAVGGLLYTVALAASMLGGVDADSALPIPGESAAPSHRSPSAPPPSSPASSRSPSARAPRGPAPEVQAPVTRSARPSPSRSSSPAAPPPSVAPTTEEPGSFFSSLFPSPRD
ncbi:hypothetical protein [Cryptosporangium japonicum]|uniref:hypothetical protein n=1 Tax=Cryptosporangium japonicum TaxID=80872 RepID=UPI0031DDC2F8